MICRSNRFAVLLAVSIVGFFVGGLAAADEPTTKPADPVTVWYDISSLVKPPPAAPPAGDVQLASVTYDDVRKVIMALVDAPSWKDNGGDVGSIIAYGHTLIILQTPDNQKAIKALLDKLMEPALHGATVTVDAYWLRLTPAQLPPGQSTIAPALLADADVIYARARAVGFEGQSVSVNVTRTAQVVTHATPVVATGAVAYDLTTASQEVGVILNETPTHVDGNNALLMNVDSTITMPAEKSTDGPTTRPAVDAATDATHGVFNSSGTQIHAKTAVRLKPGVPTVVAGMTDRPGSSDGSTLCLVLCATVDPAKP